MLVPWLLAPNWTLKLYLLSVLLFSPIALALYYRDARRLRKQLPQLAAWKLHMTAFVGGWPGAWLGHKWFDSVRPFHFRVIFWIIIVIHLVFLGMALISFILR